MKEGVSGGKDISIAQKMLEILWPARFIDRTEVEVDCILSMKKI
jgi:hypothetical protein